MAWLKLAVICVASLLSCFVSAEGKTKLENNDPYLETEFTAERSYMIRNRHSGLYIGPVKFSNASSTKIEQNVLQSDQNRASQLWKVLRQENGNYYIINERSGHYLHIAAHKLQRNGLLEQYTLYDRSIPTLTWQIRPDRDGYYTIQGTRSPFYLSVDSYSTHEGARIVTWDLGDGSLRHSQQWSFEVEDLEDYPATSQPQMPLESEITQTPDFPVRNSDVVVESTVTGGPYGLDNGSGNGESMLIPKIKNGVRIDTVREEIDGSNY